MPHPQMISWEDDGTLQRHMMTCPCFVILGVWPSTDCTHVHLPARSDPKQLLEHLLLRHSPAALHKEHGGGCLCAWAMVSGSPRQLFFISATIPTLGVHGKDNTLLFGVEKGQFLCSGQQAEHKRHTELHPQAVHGWGTLAASSQRLFLQKDKKKKKKFFHHWKKKILVRSMLQSKP